MNVQSLAFVGDAVQELYVRTRIAEENDSPSGVLHTKSVVFARCESQAQIVRTLFDELTPQEQAVFRRARNAHGLSVPKHASPGEYQAATGWEAVLGYLSLTGDTERTEYLLDAYWQYIREREKEETACREQNVW